jgi:hypothetical protein
MSYGTFNRGQGSSAARPSWDSIAWLVRFSRVFLSVHYSGDDLSGALSGTLPIEFSCWVIDKDDGQRD